MKKQKVTPKIFISLYM